MSINIYKSLVLFSLDQVNTYIKHRNEDYLNNRIQDTKPIVFKENLSLYEEEALYLLKTKDFIEKIDISEIVEPDDFNNFILKEILNYYNENGVPKVCYLILTDKLNLALEFYKKLNKD